MSVEVLDPAQSAEPPTPITQSRCPILLVDPDPSSLEYMERALSQAGMQVLATDALAGPDGALQFLSQRKDIQVIVLDPVVVAQATEPGPVTLQKITARADIELILVTESRASGDLAAVDLDAPWGREAADVLPKPVLRRTLIRAVLEAQRRHASQRDRRAPLRVLTRADDLSPPNLPRRPPAFRDHPLELRILDALADIDDLRTRQLDGIVEGDAAWSMLAELLRARLTRRRISVTSLCLASKSPVTTALRRIERLLEAGLVTYSLDPKDRRRKYIELTEDGALRLHGVVSHLARWLSSEPRNGTTGL